MSDIQHQQEAPRYSVRYGQRTLSFYWTQADSKTSCKAVIHVHPNGEVEVQTPVGTPLIEAKQALLKRARWVTEHLDEIHERRRHVLTRDYVSGETLFYLGRRYVLKRVPSDDQRHVKLLRGQLQVTGPDLTRERVKGDLRAWYRQRAKEVFQRRLAHLVGQLHWLESRPDWRLLDMKTQWGSCSPKGVILLNPHLVKAPTECIDYVILHELCHLEEHNHSQRFYDLLRYAMPRWEVVKHRLDGMSEILLNE
ncbi:SprT family zinc-dependent metalloprotease [Halomonas sp.]|uniref:M48 family metallopeptidase n=1 Tax=Halomonas sp. TaxID=1486246 RepID=UPI00298E9037|nr:SprT family zinc-dependent metalloprotease [Halomonas sp.]MDW7746839.1 SprT family zinc-dependent metalloprotease [Halomonas sp.]